MTAENTADAGAPDTIVLIHGLWVTPRSWEKWVERYEGKGYRVLTPAYPGFEVEVEALNEDPSPIEALTIPEVVEHLENIVGELENPPSVPRQRSPPDIESPAATLWVLVCAGTVVSAS